MSMELYVFPPSPRAFKVMAVANHLGLDYEIRFVDLRKGAEAGASMRKDVDGGWPGMLEHFKREAEASRPSTQAGLAG